MKELSGRDDIRNKVKIENWENEIGHGRPCL
jgi:hypothetical protein